MFTARYAMSRLIKQTRLAFKRLGASHRKSRYFESRLATSSWRSVAFLESYNVKSNYRNLLALPAATLLYCDISGHVFKHTTYLLHGAESFLRS